jgi:hypothetical protein
MFLFRPKSINFFKKLNFFFSFFSRIHVLLNKMDFYFYFVICLQSYVANEEKKWLAYRLLSPILAFFCQAFNGVSIMHGV